MIRLGKRLTIVQSDKGRFEAVPLELMGAYWHAIGVSTNNRVVIFVVGAQEILRAFRTNEYIMCLKPCSMKYLLNQERVQSHLSVSLYIYPMHS